MSSSYSVTLLLKLAAAALSGTAVLLSWRRLLLEESVSYQRRDILRHASAISPPSRVLVIGFRAQGKSSFINTACRVLSGEDGPLVLRSETAPTGTPAGPPITRAERVVRVVVAGGGSSTGWWALLDGGGGDTGSVVGGGGQGEDGGNYIGGGDVVAMEAVDTPGFSGGGAVREEVEEAMCRQGGKDAECVVVVMSCPGVDLVARKAALRKLEEMTTVVREHGLNVVVVLTHKKSMRRAHHALELRDEVAVTARTDCVYLVDNYTASSSTSPEDRRPRDSFSTSCSVLAAVRQCMEFAAIHRSHKEREEKEKEKQMMMMRAQLNNNNSNQRQQAPPPVGPSSAP